MRVLALVPSQTGHSPGQRSSIELWEKPLAVAGIQIEYAPFETDALRAVLTRPGHFWIKAREMVRGLWRRGQLVTDLRRYDAIFLYREAALIGPAFFERWIARRKPIIYELDDPLYVPYVSPANGYLSYLKFFGKVATICALSRVVIVNSKHHGEFAARFNKDVREIPSLVDGDVFFRVPRPSDTPRPCIGWSGSASTAPNLAMIAGPLRDLARIYDYRLHLIGATRFDLPGVEFTSQEWRGDTEVADLRQFDIGLVPLPDNEWNRRKFYLKVVQYMTLGIVPVATPLGSNPEVIEHGVTGFLARGPTEWVEFLQRLLGDAELRVRMSQRAAQISRERFTLEAHAASVVDAFRSVVNRGT